MPMIEPRLLHTVVKKYEGETDEDGLPHGRGTAIFRAGHVYQGDFFKGYMHGTGTYTWADGLVYSGTMKWGTVAGHGQYTWVDGTEYKGDIQHGIAHGSGHQLIRTPEGHTTQYRGGWVDGVRHGVGRLVCTGESGSQYDGSWKNDAKDGTGLMVYASGSSYEGEWRDDKRHGFGVMMWVPRAEEYRGTWVNGVPDGRGEYTWWVTQPRLKVRSAQVQCCNRYLGEYRGGLQHGYGRFFYASGAYYEGQWEDHRRHGRGVFIFEDGTVLDSVWVKGSPSLPVASVRPKTPEAKLRIDDVLAECSNEEPVSALRSVASVLIRFASELRTAYNAYAVMPVAGAVSGRDLGVVVASGEEEVDHEEAKTEVPVEGEKKKKSFAAMLAGGTGALAVAGKKALAAQAEAKADEAVSLFQAHLPRSHVPEEAIWAAGRPSFMLMLCQLHVFLEDVGLPSPQLSLAVMDEMAALATLEHPSVLALRSELAPTGLLPESPPATHDLARELSFRDFCEVLVRIAQRRFGHLPTLERRVHMLLAKHVAPIVADEVATLDARDHAKAIAHLSAGTERRARLEDLDVQSALTDLDDVLYAHFCACGGTAGAAGAGEASSITAGTALPIAVVPLRAILGQFLRAGLVRDDAIDQAAEAGTRGLEGDEEAGSMKSGSTRSDAGSRAATPTATASQTLTSASTDLSQDVGGASLVLEDGRMEAAALGVSVATFLRLMSRVLYGVTPLQPSGVVVLSSSGEAVEGVEGMEEDGSRVMSNLDLGTIKPSSNPNPHVLARDMLSLDAEVLYVQYIQIVVEVTMAALAAAEHLSLGDKVRTVVVGALGGSDGNAGSSSAPRQAWPPLTAAAFHAAIHEASDFEEDDEGSGEDSEDVSEDGD